MSFFIVGLFNHDSNKVHTFHLLCALILTSFFSPRPLTNKLGHLPNRTSYILVWLFASFCELCRAWHSTWWMLSMGTKQDNRGLVLTDGTRRQHSVGDTTGSATLAEGTAAARHKYKHHLGSFVARDRGALSFAKSKENTWILWALVVSPEVGLDAVLVGFVSDTKKTGLPL